MIDCSARLALLQDVQRLRTISDSHAIHTRAMSHLQVKHRITDHQRLLRARTAVSKNLMNHQWIGLARRFVRTTSDIEEAFPTLPSQNTIKTTTPLSSRDSKHIPGITKLG